ncbi:cell cycle protein [Ornithobacterium rhinotracheale]|uniref:Cell wall polymerase n=1 Tax=Ornithobacterium rhinotracheale TaxID=28251 RepID=A0A3R6AT03_ORNRH|nr:rod shape-determining protein RodA [Ornithobacterium rhinotracheale]QAR29945.1 cell cycle protein [Ornithobacterium rhinotracheale]
MQSSRFYNGIDWPVILMVLVIMAFGVANIYSVDPDYGVKQIVRIGLGFGMIFFFMIITSFTKNFFDIYAFLFYIAGVLSLVGVLFVGKEINGAKAWYSIGGVGIQPVELMKIATGLMIAHILNIPSNDIREPKTFLMCMGFIAIPAVLILLQPDVGSLFVFGSFFLAMYREGMSPFFLLIPIGLGGVFLMSVVWDSSLLIAGIGFLFWLIITLFTLFSGRNKLSFRGMYALMGLYFGLGLFFILNTIFTKFFLQDLGIESIISRKTEIMVNISSLLMAIICFITCLGIYLSNRDYDTGISQFVKIKASHTRQFLSFALLVIFSMGIVMAISFNAGKILEKLPKHQRERIMVLFEGEGKYRDTSGYNLLYSKTAIGSGELWGTGWNKGTITDGRFVPEQWTDYIFCTVGEEWGFVGSSALVLLYACLIARLYYLAESQKTTFARFFGYSVASILLLHFFINIGMVIGLFPTVGIPLPFLSYGGSSLWGFMFMLFIFLKLNYENNQTLI